MAAAFLHGVTAASAAEAAEQPEAAAPAVGGGPRQRWDCVAFAADGDIYVVNLDGTGLTRVSADGHWPVFSPDGTKIAYVRGDKDTGRGNAVYVMNVDGTGKRRLSPAKEVLAEITNLGDVLPVFPPDGDRVAATRGINGGGDIIFFPTSGGAEESFSKKIEDAWKRERRPIPTGPPLWGDVHVPVFSGDGRRVAYLATPDSFGSWLCIAEADGSGARLLVSGTVHSHALTPDGTKLAFNEWMEEGWLFCVINADGTGRRQLAKSDLDSLDCFSPAFSADGKKIVYESSVRRGLFDVSDIYIINADGSDRRALTRTPVDERLPHFTPDGSKIVFCAWSLSEDDSAESGIYVMNADGSGRRFLVAGYDFSLGPSLIKGRLLDSYGNWHDVVGYPEATPPGLVAESAQKRSCSASHGRIVCKSGRTGPVRTSYLVY